MLGRPSCTSARPHFDAPTRALQTSPLLAGARLLRTFVRFPPNRILAIETGGCPHAAIREDISANLMACETLTARHQADIILVESGGGASP